MAFDYHKTKDAHSSDSFWTSYSDLFLGLSTIFLLLYVTASLRTGTDAIRSQIDNQKLTFQVEELKNQLKMYEAVKTEYLETKASQSEIEEYQELMDKLTLLQEEAKDEREKLVKDALEHEKKEAALNKYQQMVRNVLNANKLAKTKLIARNDLIQEQDGTISEQQKDIKDLSQAVNERESEIENIQNQMGHVKSELVKNKQDLMNALKSKEISKKIYDQKMAKLNLESQKRLKELEASHAHEREMLKQAAEAEKQALQAQSTAEKNALQARAAAEKSALQARAIAEQEGLRRAATAEKEALAAKAAQEKALLNNKIAGLDASLKDTKGQLGKAREEMDSRREVAREIKKGFQAAGIKADVNMGTGEVVIDFGNTYFEIDSSNLKPEMKAVIEKAMPVYSKSLFGNPKIASKISSVEVVGFASPTYKGKYVDPNSNDPEDKMALKYNMDLSYRRANSIFTYLLEKSGPEFKYQKNLLSYMKVSGRSFLEVMNVKSRGPASASEFCKVNDCKKAQRVIVRFSMDSQRPSTKE